MNKHVLYVVLLWLGIFTQFAHAQSLTPTVIASDGGYYTSTSGSLSWTLGEPVSETFSITGNFLTQGFQQPSMLLVSTADPASISNLFIYPNPASSGIFISTTTLLKGSFSVQLLDLTGKMLIHQELQNSGQAWYLDLQDIANGIYLVRVQGAGTNYSEKIIKTN